MEPGTTRNRTGRTNLFNNQYSNIGTPNSEAFIGFAAALILPKLVNKSECRDPYMVAVNHAEKLMAALAKKGGEQ